MFKRTALTGSYYAAALSVLLLLNKASPSGPCTPGAGIFAFILFIPVSFALLLRNIYITTKVGKENLLSTLIHVVACSFILVPFV